LYDAKIREQTKASPLETCRNDKVAGKRARRDAATETLFGI